MLISCVLVLLLGTLGVVWPRTVQIELEADWKSDALSSVIEIGEFVSKQGSEPLGAFVDTMCAIEWRLTTIMSSSMQIDDVASEIRALAVETALNVTSRDLQHLAEAALDFGTFAPGITHTTFLPHIYSVGCCTLILSPASLPNLT